MVVTIIKILATFLNVLFVAFTWIFPFVYVFKTGKYLKGVVIYWGLCILFAFLISVVIPGFLAFLLPDYLHTIYISFPEAIIITPILLFGWLSALVICGIAYGIFLSRKVKRSSKSADDSKQDS